MLKTILKILYPSVCIFCNKNLKYNEEFEVCEDCYNKLIFFDNNYDDKTGYVKYYDKILATFLYDGEIKRLIKEFKYKHEAHFFRTFANLIFINIKINADVMVSVPLYEEREKARGYNQAHLLACELSKLMKIKYYDKILKRVRPTDQLALCNNKMQRLDVIKGAFILQDNDKIKDKDVVIIDDVFTTGATINECSKILKFGGAKSVTAIVLAKTKILF